MKAVIDTNVVVSAAWRDRDPETVVLWIAAEPGWQWIVSEEILIEYIEVLSRPKFNLTEAQRQRWHDLIKAVTTIVEVKLPLDFPALPAVAGLLSR